MYLTLAIGETKLICSWSELKIIKKDTTILLTRQQVRDWFKADKTVYDSPPEEVVFSVWQVGYLLGLRGPVE